MRPAHPFESATIPPILSFAAISLRAMRGPLMAWRVLPAVTVAAAMRASAVVFTRPWPLPHDEPAPRTLLPVSRRSRLAAGITADAGALLPHPFTPYLSPRAIGGSALCCRLASHKRYRLRAPAYCFAGQPSALRRTRSREVPLESRSSGGISLTLVR